jgi:3D (Asp-Asp-Asp) domain-containing protein
MFTKSLILESEENHYTATVTGFINGNKCDVYMHFIVCHE